MFTIQLRGEPRRKIEADHRPDEPGEVVGIIADLTEALEDAGGVEFRVSGFGQEKWPLDVVFDLLECLSQIEDVVQRISRGEPAVLGFWEQAHAREIEFVPEGRDLRIECRSYEDAWVPSPSQYVAERASVLKQLRSLVVRFMEVVKQSSPQHAALPEMTEWLDRIVG